MQLHTFYSDVDREWPSRVCCFINWILSSKTSNLCGIVGVEYGIPKQGPNFTDKKSVGKRNVVYVRAEMYMYNDNYRGPAEGWNRS